MRIFAHIKKNLQTSPELAALILIWVFLLLVLPWRGSYLLNDSYFYEWNVRHFPTRGLNFHAATAPTTIFQTILGAAIYTFSQDPGLLRLLTSIFFILGGIYFYKISLLEKVAKKPAFLLTLLLIFNPLYLNLGFSFMSDIYFLSTFLIAVYHFLLSKQVEEAQTKNRLISAIFMGFAFLSRQQTILLIPGFILTDLLTREKRTLKKFGVYAIPIGVFLVYQLLLPKTLVYMEGSVLNSLTGLTKAGTYLTGLERFIKTLFYMGLYATPISLALIFQNLLNRSFFKPKNLLLFLGGTALLGSSTLFFWQSQSELMFYIPNILTYAGFLPASLQMGIKQTLFVNSPVKIRAVITLISIISFGGICQSLTNLKVHRRFIHQNIGLSLFLFTALPSMAVYFLFRSYFDRYTLIILPLLLLYAGKYMILGAKTLRIAYGITLMFCLISVGIEHDYLTLNKTIWEIPNRYELNKMDVYSSFEFNEYFRLEDFDKAKTVEETKSKPWMPKREDYKYYVSYMDLPGYNVKERVDYTSLISPGFKGSLVILEASGE